MKVMDNTFDIELTCCHKMCLKCASEALPQESQ